MSAWGTVGRPQAQGLRDIMQQEEDFGLAKRIERQEHGQGQGQVQQVDVQKQQMQQEAETEPETESDETKEDGEEEEEEEHTLESDAALAWRLQQEDQSSMAGTLSSVDGDRASDAATGEGQNGEQEEEGGATVDADLAFALALQQQEEEALREERRELRRRQQASQADGSRVRMLYTDPDDEDYDADGYDDERHGQSGEGAEEEDEEGPNEFDVDEEVRLEEEMCLQGADGYAGKGRTARMRGSVVRTRNGEIVTKHNAHINGRLNALSLEQYEGFGDLDKSMRVPNTAYNSIKRHLQRSTVKGINVRSRGEARNQETMVIDEATRLLLFKMVNAGVVDDIHGVIKSGKEAYVFTADHWLDDETADAGRKQVCYAVKIFRTTLNEFSGRSEYYDGDHRYGREKFNAKGRRHKFKAWAEKEYRNLIRAHRAGVPCPEPVLHRQHIVLMQFIGDFTPATTDDDSGRDADCLPAPQLHEISASQATWDRCYLETLHILSRLYKRCRLVHADLSEFNLLFYKRHTYAIDFGQAVDLSHPRAHVYLMRDINNITRFFHGKGVAVLHPSMAYEVVIDEENEFTDCFASDIFEDDAPLDAVRELVRRIGPSAQSERPAPEVHQDWRQTLPQPEDLDEQPIDP